MQGDHEIIDLVQDDMDIEISQKQKYLPKTNQMFEHKYAIAKYQLIGSEQEKQQVLMNRLSKYFLYGHKIDPRIETFCPELSPVYDQEHPNPIDTKIVLFGADLMKKKAIRQKMRTDDIVGLNDTNRLLTYATPELAYAALSANARDKNIVQIKLQNDEVELPKGWIPLRPYIHQHIEYQLFARYATFYDKPSIHQQDDYPKKVAKKLYQNSIETPYHSIALQKCYNYQRERSMDKHNGQWGDKRLKIKRKESFQKSSSSFSQKQNSVDQSIHLSNLRINDDLSIVNQSKNNIQESFSNLSFLMSKSEKKKIQLQKGQEKENNISIQINNKSVQEQQELNVNLSIDRPLTWHQRYIQATQNKNKNKIVVIHLDP